MGGKTPAQLYSLVFGAVLLLVGILGFFVNASFAVGESVQRDQLILFDVNGWHNIVHIASGIVGLAMAGTPASARLFALGFGAVYALVFLLGLFMDPLLGLLPINAADNVLHLLIALAGIGAGLASGREPAPTTA
ncbi:MAG: DUF4383 domain-containing protein [Thermoleophilaceae bacterium]